MRASFIRLVSLLVVTMTVMASQKSVVVHAQETDTVRGTEWAAAVNSPPRDVKVEGSLFLPQAVGSVRAVIVVIRFGLGGNSCCYYDPQWRKLAEKTGAGLLLARVSTMSSDPPADVWRNAALGGAEVLLSLLQRLAADSAHAELQDAPLLFWGHSAAGPFGTTFAAIHPDRTVGFIRYHSGIRGADMSIVSRVPALFLVGAKDTVAGVDNGESLWKSGRAMDAPWTYAVEPDATHGEVSDAEKANALLIPWVEAVFRQRLGDRGLRPVSIESTWLGDTATGEIAPSNAFVGSKLTATWLPDEDSARGWRIVTGRE